MQELVAALLTELESLGSEQTRKIYRNHGAPADALFGVSVADLQKIRKRLKTNHELALALYATGNSDAMYLAGIIANPAQMTRDDLNRWCRQASWYMISEYTVAGVAADSPLGQALAQEWIQSADAHIASAGWATLSAGLSLVAPPPPDATLVFSLLQTVKDKIHAAPNRVRYTMNGFVIAAGGYDAAMTPAALEVAAAIGKVQVEMGGTACKVPDATAYIRKMEEKGSIGKRRKSAIC